MQREERIQDQQISQHSSTKQKSEYNQTQILAGQQKQNTSSKPAPQRMQAKLIVIGASAVGKTSLINTYTHKSFQNLYKPTIGCDFTSIQQKIGETDLCLYIWDTAGQESFTSSLVSSYYRGSDAVLIVFDVCDAISLNQTETWSDNFRKYVDTDESFPIFLVGNKNDKEEFKVINEKEMEEQAEKLKIQKDHCYFVSAKTGENIDTLFQHICQSCVSNYKGETDDLSDESQIEIDIAQQKKQQKCC